MSMNLSHLTARVKPRLTELLVIVPVVGTRHIQESGKSVGALGDTELKEATYLLSENASVSVT